jgi:vanillate monooxygenase ferredoxin subunit
MAWRRVRIASILQAATRIRAYELVDPSGTMLPPFEAGAHLSVRLANGIVRQYSLAGDPVDRRRYAIAVLHDRNSRGGSALLHESWKAGDIVDVSDPVNHFPLAEPAVSHLLIAGGIGVTPILAMARVLVRRKADFALYYCARSSAEAAFVNELAGLVGPKRFHIVYDQGDRSRMLDVRALLADWSEGHHVYVCGPTSLIKSVRESASHWPAGTVHFESFGGTPSRNATAPGFTIKLASNGATYAVEPGASILETLERHGVLVASLCRQGYCGTCLVGVKEGAPDHRDTVLTEEERAKGDTIAVCCSASKSPLLVLDI